MKRNFDCEQRANGNGLAMWLIDFWRNRKLFGGPHPSPLKQRIELVERIALGPRQSLALIEADGRRILIATSNENSPVFFALDEQELTSAIHPETISC